jgi:alpha-glucoside transport system permease protein
MTVKVRTARAPAPDAGLGSPRQGLASRVTSSLGGGLVQLFLAAVALIWTIPTAGLLIASLRAEADNATTGWWTALADPGQLTAANYGRLLRDDAILGSFVNTVAITVPATVLVVAVAALAGYAFACLEFPGRDALFLLVVGLLVVPVQVGLIPVARLFGALNLFGTTTGVVLFHTAFGLPFAIFLLRNFFAGIPRDLIEAARIDGAGELTIFRKVIAPLGLPAIAALATFQFLWVWNDLLVALIFAGADSQPLTVALQQQVRQFGANLDVLAPGAFLSLGVPLVVFFAFQRYFVQGLLAGSVK